MYYFGQGTAADYNKARKWFEQATSQKNSMAFYNLACIHYSGHGARRTKKKPAATCKKP
ncbi:TPA: sel1 repeat family protein [Neisseria gonorrhoeae]|nr:Sel1 domain-containing protein [Neisseria gonorrhoeae]QBK53816.1 hypothetical protein TFGB2_00579 [Neisseria gonorrhoeae]CFC31406.1 sel1 repeat protein [Neisseria gonorrhoeae]CFH20262.1 sel1 repeat protein [Neisseria gonorrhoeae]CFR93928.1 sel1 repeat protein [Neisseria gonorrhoeae]